MTMNLPYRLIAIDLDDTLLGDDLQISRKNKEAIEEVVRRGGVVTIATGRMFQSAQIYAKQLAIDVPIITYQGAFVRTLLSEEVLYEKFVPQEIARRAVQIARDQNIHVHLYFNDTLYADVDDDYMKEYSELAGVPYEVIDDLLDIEGDAMKVLFVDTPERLDEFATDLHTTFGTHVHITKSKPQYLEMTHPQATKGQALTFLANRLDIPMTEVMAFGDSFNDRDMIEIAGLGIAMENGHPAIREIADYVTKSNNEHGVYEGIRRFILDKM